MGRQQPLEGRCEASRGIDRSSFQPRILMCRQPGIERPDVNAAFGTPILCDECYPILLEKYGTRPGMSG